MSNSSTRPPAFIGPKGSVDDSLIDNGCTILGSVERSVISQDVYVGKGAVVEDSVLMNGVTVGDGATVRYSILDENVSIGKKVTVGESRETASGIAVVGAGISIADGQKIDAGAMISE
jgi:glucose-1-phosphate adenylyltransferase